METITRTITLNQPPQAIEKAKLQHQWKSKPLSRPIAERTLLQKSLLFAELSDAAYYAEQAAAPLFREIGFNTAIYFEREGAQAYIVSNEHDAVVICRGTEPNEWNDLKADVTVWTVLAESVGRVHRGFKEEVDTLWPLMEATLAQNDKTTWFTGHSLGAAMAAICAGRCVLSKIESSPAGLFTYGSPRVGSRRYVNHCRFPEYFRWVNNSDIVTRLPPIWLGYRHAGRLMYFDCDGQFRRMSKAQRPRTGGAVFGAGSSVGGLIRLPITCPAATSSVSPRPSTPKNPAKTSSAALTGYGAARYDASRAAPRRVEYGPRSPLHMVRRARL